MGRAQVCPQWPATRRPLPTARHQVPAARSASISPELASNGNSPALAPNPMSTDRRFSFRFLFLRASRKVVGVAVEVAQAWGKQLLRGWLEVRACLGGGQPLGGCLGVALM